MKASFSAISACLYSIIFMISGLNPVNAEAKTAYATFAGGCFWCLQADFDKVKGVLSTTVGYTGGQEVNPTYSEVSSGATGHYEALRVIYDPSKVSYANLLNVFWHNIDPTDALGQFCDKGKQYRAAIFYHNEEQKNLALKSREKIEKEYHFNRVVTEVIEAGRFYHAEDYHQKYYKKNPLRYKFYRYNCGRDQRLRVLWGEKK